MFKIKNLKIKLLGTAAYIVFIMFMWHMNIGCIWQSIFHIPCIGCGITRALLCAVRFDFISAFEFHPMFWSVPIIYLYILKDGVLFKSKALNYCILFSLALCFVVSYLFKLH